MSRRKDPLEQEIEDSVKRLVGAVGRGLADTLERTVDGARERHEAQRRAREEQQRKLEERKRRRKSQRFENRTRAEGWVLVTMALLMFVMGLAVRPDLWWLMFPGFFIGLRGAAILGHKAEQARLQQPPPLPADPREARLERTCAGLLAALKESPDHVKAFLGKPEQTVQSLQSSARDLLSRERQLRALVNPEEEGRLAAERDRLAGRVARESDTVTRERFSAALAAVDQQIAQRREVARNADRLEAEHTRLIATLEGLHVNVVRLRSADVLHADVAGAGLQSSLDALREEVNALADAAEEVNRIEAWASPPADSGPALGGTRRRERE